MIGMVLTVAGFYIGGLDIFKNGGRRRPPSDCVFGVFYLYIFGGADGCCSCSADLFYSMDDHGNIRQRVMNLNTGGIGQ